MSDTLYVAAKAPRPGFAKTRLSRAVGIDAALALYRAFLSDLALRFTSAALPLAWYVTPPDAWDDLLTLLPPTARHSPVLAQQDGDWTIRQQHLFQLTADDGQGRTVLIGSDSPQITVATIQHAFLALDTHDVVLGPVYDGGYYLIGMRGWHDVLGGVTMSTGSVLHDILARAKSLGVSVSLLPATYDIDEGDDLQHLYADIATRDDLPATRGALAAFNLFPTAPHVPLVPLHLQMTANVAEHGGSLEHA